MSGDNWQHRSRSMLCVTCMWWVEKPNEKNRDPKELPRLGRCRKRAPTLDGWPAVFQTDWCGDHKLDEGKV